MKDNRISDIQKIERTLPTFDGLIENDKMVRAANLIITKLVSDAKRSNYQGLAEDVARLVGYYATIEPIANQKNAEANVAYIVKKRYRAGTFLAIKNRMEKITNEVANKETDNDTYEIMIYENEKRLEADNYQSVCAIIKTAISVGQTILKFAGAGQYHS